MNRILIVTDDQGWVVVLVDRLVAEGAEIQVANRPEVVASMAQTAREPALVQISSPSDRALRHA